MSVQKMQFKIAGMDCVEEVTVLKKELGQLVGGQERLSFDLLNEIMTVTGGTAGAESVQAAVARTGMKAVVWREGVQLPLAPETFFERWGRTILTVASGLFTFVGFLAHWGITQSLQDALGSEGMGTTHHVPLMARMLFVLGIVTGAWFVMPRALLAIRRLQPDMNLLMTISVLKIF